MKLIHTPADQRYAVRQDWLDSKWHFSFDHYYDPANVSFGALRVFNDDRVAPASGFDTHPHREMEIVTILLEGELEHRDTTGGHSLMRAGDVQRMTAGTGLAHSEKNPHPSQPDHLLQIWVLPKTARLTPGYEQKSFPRDGRLGRLQRIVTEKPTEGELTIHQDADFYLGALNAQQHVTFSPRPGRRQYLFVIEGGVTVNDRALNTNDQGRITGAEKLDLVAGSAGTDLLLIDLG